MATPTAPPLDREELMPQLVTDAGAYTTLRYLSQREETPSQWELERKGEEVLPGTPAALTDIYHLLSAYEPEMRPAEEIRSDRRYIHTLLGQTAATQAFQEVRTTTMGSSLLAFMGTQEVGKSMLALVPKSDRKALKDMANKQADANEAEQQAQEAEAQAEAFQELLDSLEQQLKQQAQVGAPGPQGQLMPGQGQPPGSGMPQPGQGQGQPSSSGMPSPGNGQGQSEGHAPTPPNPPSGRGGPGSSGQPNGTGNAPGQLTAAQAKMLANKLAELKKLQGEAQAARDLANEAKAKAQAAADALLGKAGTAEAQKKLDELRRLGIGAMQQAGKKVKEVSNTIQAWGFEEGDLSEMSPERALALLQALQENATAKKVMAILGRLRPIAEKKAKSTTEGEAKRTPRLETGRDLSRLHQSELVAYSHPATRIGFLKRWAGGTLRLHGTEIKRTLGKGSFVVCEDVSISMGGPKHEWATAVSLAAAHYAKVQGRTFGRVVFESVVKSCQTYEGGRLTPQQVLSIAQTGLSGGTNFEAPLRQALKMIRDGMKNGLQKADILFDTDGDCAVSDAFLNEFLAAKKELGITVVAILCDAGDHVSDATVRLFADRIERVSSFTAEEAGTKVFGHF